MYNNKARHSVENPAQKYNDGKSRDTWKASQLSCGAKIAVVYIPDLSLSVADIYILLLKFL